MRAQIESADYRAGSAYRFVPIDRLSATERAVFRDLESDPDTYAILVPLSAGAHTLKAIDQQTALVYLTLREPGPLPSLMRATLGDELPETVTRLVLDGILEIRNGDEFVSGPAAAALLNTSSASDAPRGRLAQLSIQALRYGQHLDITDVRALAARLYAFNRHALTPAWGRRLATRRATAHHLGLGDDAMQPPSIGWVAQGATEKDSSWIAWRSTVPVTPQHDKPVYKLYVSPQPSMAAESLRITAEALHKRRTHGLKVGADVHGLLRPDKIIAYFGSFEDLAEAASSLAPRLAGVAAHGVPFTAEISADGLLSWGVDPPRQEWTPTSEGESWRLWVVRRLASALVASRSASNAGEPWRYALNRIALEGIDTSTWVPSQGMFAARTSA